MASQLPTPTRTIEEHKPLEFQTKKIALKVAALYKHYGERQVLDGLSLSIPEGAFVAVIGKSGCGKSTLLRLIAGLEEASNGTIYLDGLPVQGVNSQVRVMFQDPRLLPWKRVLDNVTLGLSGEQKERGCDVLRDVGLAERANEWPTILSGGQKQRVALARALASHPRFLLLDEPLGALDALTRFEMQGLIERIWQENRFTALLVTHDVEEAVALADVVVLIEDGQVVLELPVPLTRPRDRSSSEYVELKAQLLRHVHGSTEAA